MLELQVQTIAQAKGITIAQIQRETQIPHSTVRRYFYSSRSGLERDKGTLEDIRLSYLERIAQVLRVPPATLIVRR
jgi:hypothetical protein